MAKQFSSPFICGTVGGLLFFAHAMLPYTHAWPLLWPVLASAVAVYERIRRGRRTVGAALTTGLQVGAAAGFIYFVTTLPALYALAQPQFRQLARSLGAANGNIHLTVNTAVALGIASLVGCGAAIIASLVALPLGRLTFAKSQAPN